MLKKQHTVFFMHNVYNFVNKKLKMLKKYLILIVITIVCINCAQYVAPTGGIKDEIPPKIITTKPANKTLNFNQKEIILNFDELIETTNLQQELLITPKPDGLMTVKNKGKSVILKFDTLFKENTTYTFNFRNGIKDLSEKNPATNLKYIFSTGNKIDSLIYSGKVKYLLRNLPASEMTIGLFDLKDSFKLKTSKPYYFIKTDTSGLFNLENIRNGNYKVIVYADRNNNLIYDDKNEEVAFKIDTLKLDKSVLDETFKVALFDKKAPKVQKSISKSQEYVITLDESLKNIKVEFQNKSDSIPYIFKEKNIIFFNSKNNDKDSVYVKILAKDSSDNELNHEAKFRFREPEKKKKEKFVEMNIQPSTGNDIAIPIKYEINFDKPINIENYQKMTINIDSTIKDTVQKNNIIWSSNKTKLTIQTKYKVGKIVTLNLEKGAFINIYGDSSSKFQVKNPVLNEEDYGILTGKVIGFNTDKKIIQLINESEQIVKEIISNEKFEFKTIKEGTYFVRIIIDSDQDGKWSRGDLEKLKQGESVFFSPNIKIKSNFEINDFNIELK